MKILKIFGVVVGIHVFALILIFANPGCSSPRKAAPSASDTVIPESESATVSMPAPSTSDASPISAAPTDNSLGAAPASFDPNAPATSVRFSPTRPGSAAAGALEAAPVADVTPASTYTVSKGDSLWTIAKKHGISVGELTTANNIRASATVRVGQKLIIPGKAVGSSSVSVMDQTPSATPAAPATTSRPRNEDSVRHVVRPGETLGAIARKYQVRVGEIATANNISDPAKIRPGMELAIPGWQSPARTAKSAEPRPAAEPAAPAVSVDVPAPEQDLDAGLKANASEPPVIQVEQQP